MVEASGPNAAGCVWLQNRVMRYSAALAASGIALGVWSLWPALHDLPFIVFLAAVVVTARIFGFGPGLLCTLASGLAIDYFILDPRFSFYLGRSEWARLIVFFGVSVLAAGLARKRWQAETRAGQIQRWMASIVESSADAILTKDKNGIITSWNPGAERLYGCATAEAIGRPVSMLVPLGQPDEIPGFFERLGRGEPIQHHAVVRLRKDGTRILVDLCLSPVRDQHGEIVGAASIAHDISLQRRAEEALRRNEKLATAGRMAAAVAHEISRSTPGASGTVFSLFLPESTGKPVSDALRALLADSPAAGLSALALKPRVDRKIS